jgi:subtilisin family serine protease
MKIFVFGSAILLSQLAFASSQHFLKFISEERLSSYVSQHPESERLHPGLLWVSTTAEDLRLDSSIVAVENEREYSIGPIIFEKSDDLKRGLWGVNRVAAPSAWKKGINGKGVIVAVVDTGVNYNHPAISRNMWVNEAEKNGSPNVDDDRNGFVDDIYGYDFINKKADPKDEMHHGSHVAGTIAGYLEADKFYGVAPEAQIMAVKTHNREGSATEEAVVKGILYAADMGANIINCSWGGAPEAPEHSKVLLDAILYASSKGAIVVAAAGNDSQNIDLRPSYPASYKTDNLIAVASTDSKDSLSYFSNYGKQSTHLAAPGSSILSINLNGGYATSSGTSMAAPHVSGVSALIIQSLRTALGHEPSVAEIKAKIISSTETIERLSNRVVSGLSTASTL